MAAADPPVIHLVLRNHWEAVVHTYACVNEPGEGVPVRAFRGREPAAAFCEEQEHLERLKVDPVSYSRGVHGAAPDGRTRDSAARDPVTVTIADAGGQEEVIEGGDYWHTRKHALSLAEARELWESLGGGQFYEVMTVPLEGEPADGAPVHVVRRVAWVWDGIGSSLHRTRDFHGRLDFGRPEWAFADRLEAEAFRVQAERRARIGQNPFAYAAETRDPVSGRASLEYPLLRDWLLDCGAPRVPKPTATETTWRRWWERTVPHLSPLQQAKAWEAFDRIRFVDVVAVELES
jgi:hypothetical protein